MVLLTLPPLRHHAVKPELEEMTALDLPAVRADVVLGLPQRPDDPEPVQPGLLPCLPQHGLRSQLTRPDTPGRDLDADFLIGVIHMPEHQQPSITDDVRDNLVLDGLVRHSDPFHAQLSAVCSLPTAAA